jgi:hypothetical protein
MNLLPEPDLECGPAVLMWNTIQIQKIVEEPRAAGHPVKDEDLARVSPLLRAHVIPNGSYDLSIRNAGVNIAFNTLA